MNTIAQNKVRDALTRHPLAAIRRRLEKLELEHLRSHAAELAAKVETLQAQLEYAESVARMWQDDCMRMIEEASDDGNTIGMTVDGTLHVMSPGVPQ